MKRILYINLTVLILTILISSITKVRPDNAFLNTIYTISGIMFSIGMGVVCTFNPQSIKNKKIFIAIKDNIINVRNSFLYFFGSVTFFYLVFLWFPNKEFKYELMQDYILVFNVSIFVVGQIFLSIIFFISNFLIIQKLNFDIVEKSHT